MGVIEKFQPPLEKASDFFSWFSWLLLLTFRVYVAWVFLKSGMHKIGDWETTLVLFEYEYQGDGLDAISGHIVSAVDEFLEGEPGSDDVTLMLLRRQ